jgi:TonB family protein
MAKVEAPSAMPRNAKRDSQGIVIPVSTNRATQINEPELNLLLPEEIFEIPLWKSLLLATRAALFPQKRSPLLLTSKPVDTGELLGDILEHPWYRLIFTNLRDGLFSAKQPPLQLTSKPVEGQNELFDALALPWYSSIAGNVRGTLFPRKLPPLELTSKPMPVDELWGFYDYRQRGAITSIAVHAFLVVLIVGATFLPPHRSDDPPKAHAYVIPLLNDDDKLVLPPSLQQAGGGGAGGDRDVLPATKGNLPKSAMQEFAPPIVLARNAAKLAMEPTVVLPPEIKLPAGKLPNLGDPMAKISHGPLSNGTGSGGGIGSGSGGGVGSGHGPGVGPGSGGGIGGSVFRPGRGISVPRPIYDPEPEFSVEARRAKYQGVVMLQLVVDADGLPRNIQVTRSLGMGLDEKAIEAVNKWRFQPARKNGQPVPVLINVEVDFSLH